MCLQLPFTKSLGKAKGARMNNPETLETLGTTQNKGKQNKSNKNKLHGHHKITNPCAKVKYHNFVGSIFS